MEEQVERLVNKVWGRYKKTRISGLETIHMMLMLKTTEKFQHAPASQRYLIAVAGIPGSGTYIIDSIFPDMIT